MNELLTFSLFLFIKKIVETKATILECTRRRRRHQCNNGFPLSSVGVVPASPFSNCKWKSISTGGGYWFSYCIFLLTRCHNINMIFKKLLRQKIHCCSGQKNMSPPMKTFGKYS